MKIHWSKKWLSICYHGNPIILQGLVTEFPTCTLIELAQITAETDKILDTPIPAVIQSVLSEFESVFVEPSGLPPPRACDHHIPLIHGARPIQIRPYRYALVLKDEIEKQIA